VCYSKIFDAVGDGSQDDRTLYSLSDEFLEAARVLQATPPTRVNYSSATYYLLGHAAELMLKAYLYKHGQTITDLKKINHDLKKLSSLARAKGLPEKVQLDQIDLLADTYNEKGFEYRTKKRKTLPSLDHLTEEIEKLQSAVFDRLWE
jgi:hypothetical protein